MGGRPLDDSELISQSKRGDRQAYEELVRRYQGIAYRTAFMVAGSSADAEEAAQDGFVKAFYALDRFRDGSAFRPWLLKIVANEARNRRRSAARRAELALRASEARPSGDAVPSPEAAALDHERASGLLAALHELREADRVVIAYRYFLELSEAEMAVVMGCARGTVKSRLARSLGRLRRVLEERGAEWQSSVAEETT